MSTFRVEVDKVRMMFPTEVSPFVFPTTREIVQQMLVEANTSVNKEREFILDWTKSLTSGSTMCWYMLASCLILPLPFFCCWFSKKQKKVMKSSEKILERWEDIAKKYNTILYEKGVFVRFISESKHFNGVQGRGYYDNRPNYLFEFSFVNNNNGVDGNMNNAVNQVNIMPPPVVS